jgi:hypothetical protein
MFYVFTGEEYYPGGGWEDFQGTAESLEAAHSVVEAVHGNDSWYQIVDASALKMVEEGQIEDITTYEPYEEKRKLTPRVTEEGYLR